MSIELCIPHPKLFIFCRAAYAVVRCPSVYLSVCPTRSCILSKLEMNKHILNLLSPSGSFSVSNLMAICRWGSPNGGVKCMRGVKNRYFRLVSRFIACC